MEISLAAQESAGAPAAPVVQVDLFVNTLRELQEEQALYQQRVTAAQTKRIAAEKKLDAVLTRHAAVQDKNNKMLAVQRAAEFKTAMAEEESARLEKLNADKKAMIKELTDAIANEDHAMMQDLHCFEDSISHLCHSLRTAHKYYTTENLVQEISNVKMAGEEAKLRVEMGKSNLISLQQELEHLQASHPNIEEEIAQIDADGCPTANDWESIVHLFQEDMNGLKNAQENTAQELKAAQDKKERLMQGVDKLEKELEKKKQEKEAREAQRRAALISSSQPMSKGRHPISPLVSSSTSAGYPGIQQPPRSRPSFVPPSLSLYSSASSSIASLPASASATGPPGDTSSLSSSAASTKYGPTTPRLITFNFGKRT
eukprot:scpid72618/ scgid7980/ 